MADAFDSPARSFVPLTLQETLTKPQRTLSSKPTRPARPSHAHHLSLATTTQERANAARRDAAALCETLGIDAAVEATPKPLRREDEGEVGRLRAALWDKEAEVGALRRQLSAVQKENGELRRIEREVRGVNPAGGLGAREVSWVRGRVFGEGTDGG